MSSDRAEPTEPADALVLRDLAWVKALARRLIGDTDLADDMAQDAWLVARTQPPARLEGGIRAWLATVVHHGVQRRRRAEQRRRQREVMAAAAADRGSPGDVVERGALCRELTAAVMDLDEPYRSVILLRYLDGLSTAEVATREGVSPVAVRKRLSRALQLLRGRLGGTYAGGFAAWGLAWRRQFGLAPVVPSSGVLLAGWSLMNLKWLTALGALLLALFVAWQWWPLRGTTAQPIAGVAVPEPSPLDAPIGDTPVTPPARSPAGKVAAVEVVDPSGTASPFVHVFALAGGALVQRAVTDTAGRAELMEGIASDELLVAVAGAVPLRVRRDANAALQRVVFPFGDVVAGSLALSPQQREPVVLRLEHDRGSPWGDGLGDLVRAQLAQLGIENATTSLTVESGETFRFRGLPPDWTGALTTDGAWTLRETSSRGSREDATTLLLLQPEHDLHLELTAPFCVRGRLLAGDTPAAGLRVHIVVPHLRQGGGLHTVVSDADGRFAVGVPRDPGETKWRGELLVGSDRGDNLLQRRIEADAGDAGIDVGDLGIGRVLDFRVHDADGVPLEGARVHVVAGEVFIAAETDAAGRARAFGVPPTAVTASVGAHAHRTAVVSLPDRGEVVVQLLAGNGIDVQVVDANGAAVTDLLVRVEADRLPFVLTGQSEPPPKPFVQAFPLDANGRRDLADLLPGLLLRLVVVDALDQEVGRAEVVTPPIGRCDRVAIEVAARAHHSEGRVVDERGRPVPRVRIHAEHGDQLLTARTDADGRFRLGPLRAALTGVHLEANHPAFVSCVRDDAELGIGATIDITLVRGRSLRARLRQQNGAAVTRAMTWITFENAPAAVGRSDADGDPCFERIVCQPGRLWVRLGGREWSQPIDGVSTDVVMTLPDLGRLRISCAAELRRDADQRVCVVVTPVEPAGEVDRQYFAREFDPNAPELELQLAPGRYRIGLEARSFGRGRARVRTPGTPRLIDVEAGAVLQLVLP